MKRESHSVDHVSNEAIFQADTKVNQKRLFSKVTPGYVKAKTRYPVTAVKMDKYWSDILDDTFASWGIRGRKPGSQINFTVTKQIPKPIPADVVLVKPKVRPAGQIFRGVSI